MMVAIIVLVAVLGIVVGYAARQREELHEAHDKIEDLTEYTEKQMVELSEANTTIETLTTENETLRNAERVYGVNLEMVLDELDRKS